MKTSNPTQDTSGNAGRRRAWIVPALVAALTMLSGCAMMTPVDAPVASESALYSGEPVALHATEMPVTSAEEARMRAREALGSRDIDLALYLYVQAVTLDPNDADSFLAIGAIHDQLGNPELAGRAYSRAAEIRPDNARALLGLGLARFDVRDFEAAERHLLAAVELDPNLWRAHDTLGILADRNEQFVAAIAHYTAAIEAQPNLASLRNNRGYSRYLAGDLEMAKRDFLAALDVDPGYERAWRNLGLVLARQQDYERALTAMTNVIPRHVALNDVGYVAMLDGNYAVARQFLQDAIRESPRHYQTAQDNLAELNRRSNGTSALVNVE